MFLIIYFLNFGHQLQVDLSLPTHFIYVVGIQDRTEPLRLWRYILLINTVILACWVGRTKSPYGIQMWSFVLLLWISSGERNTARIRVKVPEIWRDYLECIIVYDSDIIAFLLSLGICGALWNRNTSHFKGGRRICFPIVTCQYNSIDSENWMGI